ncbi:ADP-ribosyl cyclase/cyclic ADP-ribose hydrolase 1 [Hippoglossus stenolepis]|uniref:ADP-ribosyl cyclase/cyclic ADP-ribose hydrolase 1 n=1 Tax=Hippoglossus stenolepis TaxID=195615 RepID=UPI001FB011E8|nr:ADP-ribosyl cyclase/cyclic ADP-ribose hydrolase 1 [Hippoglossus stenolepis]
MESMESLDPGDVPPPEKRRSRRTCAFLGVACVLLLCVTVAVVMVTVRHKPDRLKGTFISRCELFQGYDCEMLWSAFKQAYVGKDPCKVPWEAYDPLIAAAPFKPSCNRMMFWSKTKDVVQDFTEKRGCFLTLEETVLGSVLDGLSWCGKEGSSETFTSGCPGWGDCENNPVGSFWRRVSAAFADVACGDVTAMLNGSIETPFSPTSIFGGIELKMFNSSRVKSLSIVLVSQENAVSNCTNASFKDLQIELDEGIKYNCTEVTESQLNECSSDPEKPCGPCW